MSAQHTIRVAGRGAAAAAAALLAALTSGACGDASGTTPLDPLLLYQRQACAQCHGPDRAGSPMAPSLRGLDAHWDEARLVEYLADPLAYAKRDERLSEQVKRYPQMMPGYAGLAPEQRAALARWLLAQ